MMHTPIRRALVIMSSIVLWQALSINALRAQTSVKRHPQVGLALSGGGARGAAHIGVLKVLEREGIHIDCVAGTSFGAIVGGLYATGYSADEIEAIVVGSNWQEVLSNQPARAKAPLLQGRSLRQLARINLRGLNPMLPAGWLRGQKLMELVNRYTIKQMLAAEYDFDRLPVRFRAVATDLLTGQPYIFKNGRMSEALRASSALPLIFAPWPKDGMRLVDGSLSNNLPADIARDMGADIVIAVDVTAPNLKYQEVRNAFNVYEQCLGLMMKRTVESHYRYADIVIRPDLNGYSNSSYAHMGEIVLRGVDSARARIPELREHIGNDNASHLAHNRADDNGPVIDSISFETNGGSHQENRAPAYLLRKVTSKPSDTIRPEKLAVDTQRLYATGLFENVDYELQHIEKNRYRLQYHLMESASNTMGVSLRYDTDYRLQALTEFSSRDLFGTASYATISSRFGSTGYHNATLRLIHPKMPFIFLEPQLQWLKRERLRFNDHQDVAGFIDRRRGAQIALGMSLHGRFEAAIGYRFETVSFSPEGLRHPNVPQTNLGGLQLHVRRDTLDAQEFPRGGMLLDLQADERAIRLGSDSNQAVWQGNIERYFSLSDRITLGVRFAGMRSRGILPDFEKAYLGGYGNSESSSLRLVGFARDELSVGGFSLAGASLRHLVLDRPMSFARRGFLTFEYNRAGINEQTGKPSDARVVQGAAIGFSLDTMIGPVRFAAGIGEARKVRICFSVGPSF
jgi:NTE family protein